MIRDFRDLENNVSIETDLCVIGAGAAGITIAREFIGSNIRACVVESGGLESEPVTQSLYRGEVAGLPYYDLDACRWRHFGGSTHDWGGNFGPLTEIDFHVRPWVPYSGWPITKADLDPYYERAQSVCGLGEYIYDARVWKLLGVVPPTLDPQHLCTRFWQTNPLRFGQTYRQELTRAENLRVLLHANVTNIHVNATASVVEHVEIRTLEGKTGNIRARAFVLACGGIENVRLLLNSNKVERNGLGNRHDLIGRFFMEHPTVRTAELVAKKPRDLAATYGTHSSNGVTYRPGICVDEETQAHAGVLNCVAKLVLAPDSASQAAVDIWRGFKKGQVPDHLDEKVWRVLRNVNEVMKSAYYRLTRGDAEQAWLPVVIVQGEQAPNPSSRVTLSEDRDALGLLRVRLDWRMTELEKRTIGVMTTTIASALERLNVARVRIADWLTKRQPDWAPDMNGLCHHIGTTRMADDPKIGVVNGNCKVHTTENLYIAGSSVFPTSGYINPTLTIVALALRLAEHLKSRLT